LVTMQAVIDAEPFEVRVWLAKMQRSSRPLNE
jgi:hypothetical protein